MTRFWVWIRSVMRGTIAAARLRRGYRDGQYDAEIGIGDEYMRGYLRGYRARQAGMSQYANN